MSDNKKYYYLKLKDNYFDSDSMRIMEALPNGYIYSNIILKLSLKSLKGNGCIMMTDRIPYSHEKVELIANVLNHDIAHVKEAIKLAVELDLITIMNTGEMWINDIQNFIGHSSTEADRKRVYRKELDDKTNGTNVRQMSDKYPPEIRDKNLEIIDKRKKLKKETSKRSKNDSNESPKTFYNKSLFLNKDIYSLFKKVLSISIIFNKHKLPETINDSCSKLLIQSQKYLLSFMNNSYIDDYVWNIEWKKKIDLFNNKTFFCTDIYLLFKKAIIRYNKMNMDGYWPYDKSNLTHNLSDFLYNPRTHKSWFLYCLCNIPKELKNENHIKIKESLPEDIQIMAETYIKNKNWNEIEYYKKVNILYDWFNTNYKDLLKYNYVFYGGNIYSYMQRFVTFFKLIDEYSTIYNNWSLSNFGYGNKTWSAFIKWILEKYGFDLEPDKDKLKKGVKFFDEKEAERKEK